jgi:hypothetical protein
MENAVISTKNNEVDAFSIWNRQVHGDGFMSEFKVRIRCVCRHLYHNLISSISTPNE